MIKRPANNCKILSFSPSKDPHKMATKGIKYVTDDANTGVEICTNLVYKTLATPVPKTARITTYSKESICNSSPVNSLKNPE